MATNVIPFESAALPAHLRSAAAEVNADLTSGVGGGFPVLSILGKSFAVVRGKERETITMDVGGETMPAPWVDVVIIKANPHYSKIYYKEQYKPGDDTPPTCYSNSGKAPELDAKDPQHKSCDLCPHNAWGSRISEEGSKGKACQDARRVAVAPGGQLNDPMLLRVPPASLRPLAEYGEMLAKRKVPYNAVLTRLKFDSEMATPKLVFEPKGFLTEAQYNEVAETSNGSVVKHILGLGIVTDAVPAVTSKPAVQEVKAEAPVEKKPEPVPEKKATKKKEPAEEPEVQAVKKPEISVELDAELTALLSAQE